MKAIDYWKECILNAAEECDLLMTEDQLNCLAEGVEGGHDNYSQAFYSPPSHERIDNIEREFKEKLRDKEKEFERFRINAEAAIKKALIFQLANTGK